MSTLVTSGPLNTAVLFIIFNRPETTSVVFNAIREARPTKLYVAADGPRARVPIDKEKCEETRNIIKGVDWPCEVKLLFSSINRGCGRGPSTAMKWFFSLEPEGIVLEDDCLPSQSFFWYCQELLEKYRDDTRVMHIGGNNFLEKKPEDNNSYYFSYSGHIWGWASWSRAWSLHDFHMNHYNKLKKDGYFDDFFLNKLERLYRLRKFSQVAAGEIDGWDYQWDFARFIHSGLAIVPARNLVKNIGYGYGATHTQNGGHPNGKLQANEIELPLKHPPHVHRDYESDKAYFMALMRERIASKLQLI